MALTKGPRNVQPPENQTEIQLEQASEDLTGLA